MSAALPPIRRHLFLTGDRQTGKSTLLRRLMEACSLECSGFETRAFSLGGERRGFTLHGRVPMAPFENDCVACVRVAQRKSVAVLPVFEENGVQILRLSLEAPAPFILMDELGRLEREAAAFCAQALACLSTEKRVLGVLQRCDSPLGEAIRARDDVTVLSVTQENREELLRALIPVFAPSSGPAAFL